MISWLRQSGHAHLLDEQLSHANNPSSAPPLSQPPQNNPFGQTNPSNFSPMPPFNYPPQTTTQSSAPPQFGGGFNSGGDPLMNNLHQSGSFSRSNFPPTSNYGGAPGSLSPTHHFSAPSFDFQSSPLHFNSSPTHFLAPNMNQQQLDMDIEVK
jgi:hypothetical protein